ncbi:MAG: DUF2341 domain-containing protein [Deltaproteobacteria bacterium]|nr:DUF2341 domain-containing protein [Deltaproteobacteria bacterium]
MGWLSGYSYRKSVTLSRASGAVANYQMRLLVGESSGSSGADVHCNGNCLSSFNDLRFTGADGITELDYWIESISGTTPNQLATVWIKFDSIGTSATTFYMYYGRAGAISHSYFYKTFPYIDGFEYPSYSNTKLADAQGSPEGFCLAGSYFYQAEQKSPTRIHEINPATGAATGEYFDFQAADSTHMSALVWDGSYLWGVDYDTDMVHKIDLASSLSSHAAVIIDSFTVGSGAGFSGHPSAMAFVTYDGSTQMMITEWADSGAVIVVDYESALADGTAAGNVLRTFYQCPDSALSPDLLNDDCSTLADWTEVSTGDAGVTVDPAGQFKFDTNNSAADNRHACLYRTIASPPNQFTLEIKTYFDSLGATTDLDYARLIYGTGSWTFSAIFASNGLFIVKAGGFTEVGTDIVKCNASAEWQTWRFEVDKTAGEGSATVEVFLNNVSQGTFDCDYETSWTDGRLAYYQYGYGNDDRICHIDDIKIATGLGNVLDGSCVGRVQGIYTTADDHYNDAFIVSQPHTAAHAGKTETYARYYRFNDLVHVTANTVLVSGAFLSNERRLSTTSFIGQQPAMFNGSIYLPEETNNDIRYLSETAVPYEKAGWTGDDLTLSADYALEGTYSAKLAVPGSGSDVSDYNLALGATRLDISIYPLSTDEHLYVAVAKASDLSDRLTVGVHGNAVWDYWDGGWHSSSVSINTGAWNTISFIADGAGNLTVLVNGTQIYSGSRCDQINYLRLEAVSGYGSDALYVDAVRIRNYSATEPAWGSWVTDIVPGPLTCITSLSANLRIVIAASVLENDTVLDCSAVMRGRIIEAEPLSVQAALEASAQLRITSPDLAAETLLSAMPRICLSPDKLSLTAILDCSGYLILPPLTGPVTYECILSGEADGLDDLLLPISSFQARLKSGDPSFMSVVVPGTDYASDITVRANGDLTTYIVKSVGESRVREKIMTVDLEDIRLDKGSDSQSITLSGHRTHTYETKTVNFDSIFYEAQYSGKRRYRLPPDLYLRPGDTAVVNGEPVTVDMITWAVSPLSFMMEIAEQN